jgi:hypothetical protein
VATVPTVSAALRPRWGQASCVVAALSVLSFAVGIVSSMYLDLGILSSGLIVISPLVGALGVICGAIGRFGREGRLAAAGLAMSLLVTSMLLGFLLYYSGGGAL